MKKNPTIILFTLFILIFLIHGVSAKEGSQEKTKCKLKYDLSSWSIFYKSGHGGGMITCDNGQTATVNIRAHGAGISFGKSKISDGKGSFSKVRDISKLFGAYASAEAHAGIVKSTRAQVVSKGKVNLTLTGMGKGYDLGLAFGRFKITPISVNAQTASKDSYGSFVPIEPEEAEEERVAPTVVEEKSIPQEEKAPVDQSIDEPPSVVELE